MDPSTCYTCGIFSQLDQLATTYGQDVFNALAPSVREAFSAFLGLYFAWQFLFRCLYRADLTVQQVVPKLFLFCVVDLALKGSGLYWDFFYTPVRETMSGLAQIMVVPAGADNITDTSIAGLLHTVETQVRRVINLGIGMMEDGGITHLAEVVTGIILCIPYVFVWGIFMAFMLEGIFKLLAITALAPLAIVAAAFDTTRGFAISAFRMVLNGVLTVVFAAVAMGFTISILRSYTALPNLLDANGNLIGKAGDFYDNGNYWAIFLLGFISILFHLKAATLAANISGASDGPGAAAAVVGAGMATLAWAKGAATSPLRRYGGKLWDKADAAIGDGAKSGGSKLAEQIANWRKPAPTH